MFLRCCVLFGLAAFAGEPAFSCSCQFGGSAACQSFHDADLVFMGAPTRVSRQVDERSFASYEYEFRVEKVLRGAAAAEIKIATGSGGGDCGYRFERGETYVVYASQSEGRFFTNICMRTRPLRDASEDLGYFKSLEEGTPASFIEGTAYGWNVDGTLADVEITLEGPGGPYRTTTENNGSFRFEDLPPGEYSVRGKLDRHVDRTFRREATLAEGGCRYLGVQLGPDIAIEGTVTGLAGAPIQGIMIHAISADDGPGQSFVSASAETDEEGRYEIVEVKPNRTYLVGVNIRFAPDESRPYYPRTYYPGVADREKAVLVSVGGPGSHAEDVDLRMPAPYERRIIRGRLLWPDGKPAEGVFVYAFDPQYESNGGPSDQTDAEGRFSIQAFFGVRYFLIAEHNDPHGESRCLPPKPIEPQGEGDPEELELVMSRPGNRCSSEIRLR